VTSLISSAILAGLGSFARFCGVENLNACIGFQVDWVRSRGFPSQQDASIHPVYDELGSFARFDPGHRASTHLILGEIGFPWKRE
jgi:hypothetical protein